MEVILLLAAGAAIAYFVLKTKAQVAEMLSPAEETDDLAKLLHYKKRIFQCSAHSEASTYELLYYRIRDLTKSLVLRHASVLIRPSAANEINENFEKYFEPEGESWRVRRALNIADVEDSTLLAMALYTQFGEKVGDKKLSQNRFFTNRATEFLVTERKYRPGTLLKALLLSYGFQEYQAPTTSEARAAFQIYGSASPEIFAELQGLKWLQELETLPNQHKSHASSTWRSQAELLVLTAEYHPDNLNG
jgi:hypothetical protein